jgi:hypothetical protein
MLLEGHSTQPTLSPRPFRQYVPPEWIEEGSPTARARSQIRALLNTTSLSHAPGRGGMSPETAAAAPPAPWSPSARQGSRTLDAEPAPAAAAVSPGRAQVGRGQAVVPIAPGDGVAFVHINLPSLTARGQLRGAAAAPAATAEHAHQQQSPLPGAAAAAAAAAPSPLTMSGVWRAAVGGGASAAAAGGAGAAHRHGSFGDAGASTSSSATVSPYASMGGGALPTKGAAAPGKQPLSSGGGAKAAAALRALLECGVPLQPTLSQAVQAALALAEAEAAAQEQQEQQHNLEQSGRPQGDVAGLCRLVPGGGAAGGVNYYALQQQMGADVAAYYMTTDRAQPAVPLQGAAGKGKQGAAAGGGRKDGQRADASAILSFLNQQHQQGHEQEPRALADAATPPPTQAFSRAQIVSALRGSHGGDGAPIIPDAAAGAAATARMSAGPQQQQEEEVRDAAAAALEGLAAGAAALQACDSSTDLAVEGPQVLAAAIAAAVQKTKVEARAMPYELAEGAGRAASQELHVQPPAAATVDVALTAAEEEEGEEEAECRWERRMAAAEAGRACCMERDIESGEVQQADAADGASNCDSPEEGGGLNQWQSEQQPGASAGAAGRPKVRVNRIAASPRLPDSPQSSVTTPVTSSAAAGRGVVATRLSKLTALRAAAAAAGAPEAAAAAAADDLMLSSPGPASSVSAGFGRQNADGAEEAGRQQQGGQRQVDLEALLFDPALSPTARAERLATALKRVSSSGSRGAGGVGGALEALTQAVELLTTGSQEENAAATEAAAAATEEASGAASPSALSAPSSRSKQFCRITAGAGLAVVPARSSSSCSGGGAQVAAAARAAEEAPEGSCSGDHQAAAATEADEQQDEEQVEGNAEDAI